MVRQASDESGHAIGIFADLQGPKIRLGKVAAGPLDLDEGSSSRSPPARCPATRRSARRPTPACPVTSSAGRPDPHRRRQGPPRGDRRRRAPTSRPGSWSPARSATTRASTCPGVAVSVPAMSEKDKEDLRWALHLTRRLHRAVVRALGRRRRGRPRDHARGGRLPSRDRQDREAAGDRQHRGDRRRLRRLHGGPRRPRRRVPARGRAVPAEAGHRRGPPARQAGHRRDPDAGVDDLRARGRPAPRPPTSPTRSSTGPTP